MRLFIAEKPQLGKAIVDALPGAAQYDNQTITKGDDVIIWCFGHLLGLKMPGAVNPEYNAWRMDTLPIYIEPWPKDVVPDPQNQDKRLMSKAERVQQIGELIKQADCVVNAGDIDDEGSLLINELLEWFNYTGPALRLDTSDTSKAGMQHALTHMQDNSVSLPGTRVAHARELADIVFGINPTRYYTLLHNAKPPLTFGRVQTPILGLVVERDRLIESHTATKFYDLVAEIKTAKGPVAVQFVPNPENDELTEGRFLAPDYLQKVASRLKGQDIPYVVSRKKEKKAPPLPFNLTELTVYAERKFGFGPEKVMAVTQSLRENHKAITYNRSDCQYLSENHWKEAPATIAVIAQNLGISAAGYDTTLHSAAFNDKNITAHFAIIPTKERVDISRMSNDEQLLYKAIADYYLAQFLPPAEYEKIQLRADLGGGEYFKATASVLLKPGYQEQLGKAKDEEEEESSPVLAEIAAGTYHGPIDGFNVVEKTTKPPARYTAASLYKDTTCIAKYVKDPAIKKILIEKDKDKKGENGSIGTPATRPHIIERLKQSGYIEEQTKGKKTYLISTQKGRTFYDILPDEIKKADTTAHWWVIMEKIRAGEAAPEDLAKDVLEKIKRYVLTQKEKVAGLEQAEFPLVCTCPKCGGDVVETPTAYACKNRCGVVIYKKFFAALGKKGSPAIVKTLLTQGYAPLKGCVSQKTGKKYDCNLKANWEGEKIELAFNFDREVLGKCPLCGSDIVETPKAYSCQNRECSAAIWKNMRFYFHTVSISSKAAKNLLAGKTITVTTKKDGKSKKQQAKLGVYKSKDGKPLLTLVSS